MFEDSVTWRTHTHRDNKKLEEYKYIYMWLMDEDEDVDACMHEYTYIWIWYIWWSPYIYICDIYMGGESFGFSEYCIGNIVEFFFPLVILDGSSVTSYSLHLPLFHPSNPSIYIIIYACLVISFFIYLQPSLINLMYGRFFLLEDISLLLSF